MFGICIIYLAGHYLECRVALLLLCRRHYYVVLFPFFHFVLILLLLVRHVKLPQPFKESWLMLKDEKGKV